MGLWSYSLYLIHSPILALGNLLLLEVPLPTIARFSIMIVVVVPVAALVAYAFHLLVERRFMTSHQKGARTYPLDPLASRLRANDVFGGERFWGLSDRVASIETPYKFVPGGTKNDHPKPGTGARPFHHDEVRALHIAGDTAQGPHQHEHV